MQGDLNKQNARICIQCAAEIFDAISKSRQIEYIGHLNDLMLFLEQAEREMPDGPQKDVDRLASLGLVIGGKL